MKSLADLQKMRDEAKKKVDLRDGNKKYRVVVGMATCGIAAGARPVLTALLEAASTEDLSCVITQTGCIGMCTLEPIVEVYNTDKEKTTYCKVTPDVARRIINEHIKKDHVVSDYVIDNFQR